MRLIALLLFAALPAFAAAAEDSPPLSLLASNFAKADVAAHVRVDAANVVAETKDDAGHAGYVTFRVHARVLETYRGDAQAVVVYRHTQEAPGHAPKAGSEVVVSLHRDKDGTLTVPDNGYVFPATPAVLERARKLAKQAPAKKH